MEETSAHHGPGIQQQAVRIAYYVYPAEHKSLMILSRYEAVWRETVKMYHEMVADEGWTTKERIDVSAIQSLTFKVSSRTTPKLNIFTVLESADTYFS